MPFDISVFVLPGPKTEIVIGSEKVEIKTVWVTIPVPIVVGKESVLAFNLSSITRTCKKSNFKGEFVFVAKMKRGENYVKFLSNRFLVSGK